MVRVIVAIVHDGDIHVMINRNCSTELLPVQNH